MSEAIIEYSAEQREEVAARMPSRVRGPQSLSGTPNRFATLVWMLGYLEFKLKFFGSALGYAWQLIRPLMLFSVLYVVFTQVLRFGDGVAFFPVTLLSAIVLFTFFSESTSAAVGSVVDREPLIRKVPFPIMAAPLATVTAIFLTLMLNYLVVLAFALATGVTPTWRWLEIPPLLILLLFVSASVSVSLSAFYVRYRDVRPIWEVFTQVLFYASPIIYPISFVQKDHETLAKIMMCNPVTTIIEQMRHAAIDPNAPSAGQVLGNWFLLLIPLGIVVFLAIFGWITMRRLAPRVAEEL
jgi:ABC-2 type transport system permease protein